MSETPRGNGAGLARARAHEYRMAIEDFHYEYAAVLDRGEIERWPEFFTEDAVYRMTARDNVDAGLPLDLVACEGSGMFKDRAYAIAHTEMYAPRYVQHHISNVRVLAVEGPLVSAEANYLILETLTDEPTKLLQSGKYYDRFFIADDRVLIKERRCVYDTIWIPNCIVYPA